jgi:DNA-binding transcriptional MerR regulator
MNMKSNHNFPLKEIDEALGIKPKGEEYYLFKNHSRLSIAKIAEVEKELIGLKNIGMMNGVELESIKNWLANFKVTLPKAFDVKVLNQIELPKNISIDNLPEKWDINEPKWLEKIYSPIVNQLKEIEPLDIERYTDPANPIAVRLSNGKRFVDALTNLTQVMQGSTVDQETKNILNAILSAIGSLSPGTVGVVKSFHNEITGVPAVEGLIVAYAVPASKNFTISQVYGSAGTDGLWTLYINSVKKWEGRNAWTDRNVFSNLAVNATAGQTIELKVTNQKNTNHLFSGGFYGSEL